MGRKTNGTFVPIDDDIDATSNSGDVLDLAPVQQLTLEQVHSAEVLAQDMQQFFNLDSHWRKCEEAIEKVRETKQLMFMYEDIKSADLYTAHLQWLHYGEALNIMRDTHQADASRLREQWEEQRRATIETPLIDAAEKSVFQQDDYGELDGDDDEGDQDLDLSEDTA